MSAKAKRVERKRLLRQIRKNPRLINSRTFVKRASLVNFKLPITVRLRGSNLNTNPNLAKLDLGASLGQRQIGLGGSLAGEITFHDSFDGGALGNVDISLNPSPKSLTTTSVPLLWNQRVSGFGTSIAPVFNLGGGTPGCGDFHGAAPITISGNQTVPYFTSQANADANTVAGYVPDTPGIDDPARLVNTAAVGDDNNLGPSANPFPYSASMTPDNNGSGNAFSEPPSPADSVLRTAPLSLGIASQGTEVTQTDGSANGPEGSQNIVIGKSGGQANLFGNIPGKGYGIDVTVNLATKINSILRSVEPDYVPLITGNHWPTTWSHCRQAYTGGVQNYIPGVRLQGSLHISPAITADGKLRIAKATLTSQSPASVALAACIYPYSLYTAENNNSDTVSQFVSDYTSGGKLPTDEFAARTAPNVNCGVPATKLVTDAPTLALNPADSANGYTTSADGTRVSVAGDISVQNVSADIVIGDVDGPPAAPPVGDAYLGLGDSIAYGYNAAQFAAQYPAINPASFNYGYVDLFGSYLTGHYPSITTVQNDGCPGETTNSLLNGFNPAASLCGKGSGFPYAFLHHNYGVNNSQLQSAQAFLTAHPNAVVSLDIGANDLLDFLQITCGFGTISYSPSCVSSGMQPKFNQITANLNSIVTALQTTAPNARLIVMGLYNPYPGALSVGAIGGDTAVAQLNSLMRGVAVAHGARFVDPLSTFNPAGYRGLAESGDVPTICALTGMCPGGTYNPASPLADIHPSKKGYQALADLFRSASGL